jgi:magnesium transporter
MLSEERHDPEAFLEELFQIWYELLAARTMAVHSGATYTRMTKRVRDVPDTAPPLFSDMADQLELVKSMANGQREFLHGVIEFYQTRTSTHTTIAAEKVASTSVQQNDDMRKITGWVARSSPSPPRSPDSSARTCRTRASERRRGWSASTTIMLAMAVILCIFFRRKKWL